MKDASRYRRGERDEAAYEGMRAVSLANSRALTEEQKERARKERNRPGGKYYAEILRKNKEGLRHKRANRRSRDGQKYRWYKKIIAPGSQIHHSWLPKSEECSGIALVETDPHRHGIIKPIFILEGSITLMTEKDIREDRTLVKNGIKGGI